MVKKIEFEYKRAMEIERRRMTPADYCAKWVPLIHKKQPDDRGYRDRCLHELSKALDVSITTVNKWGNRFENYPRPDAIERGLAKQDFINETFWRSRALATTDDPVTP